MVKNQEQNGMLSENVEDAIYVATMDASKTEEASDAVVEKETSVTEETDKSVSGTQEDESAEETNVSTQEQSQETEEGTDVSTEGGEEGADATAEGSEEGTEATTEESEEGTDASTEGSEEGTDAPLETEEGSDSIETEVPMEGMEDLTGMEGMEGMEGMFGEVEPPQVKQPIMSQWPFVIGISVATLVVSVVLGILLAKRRIKKGIELYED